MNAIAQSIYNALEAGGKIAMYEDGVKVVDPITGSVIVDVAMLEKERDMDNSGLVAKLTREIAQIEVAISHLENALARPFENVGSFVTGRSGRSKSMDKKTDRENARREKQTRQLKSHLSRLARKKAQLARYSDSSDAAPSPSKHDATRIYTNAVLKTVHSGDLVCLAANPNNRVQVKSVNRKSITDMSGVRWGFLEIIPLAGDRPMTPAEIASVGREMFD